MNANLYALFRSRFPTDLDDCWIETADAHYYSWRDLERGSAKIANLLASLNLPSGSRIAAQVEKSPEALMLYLATVRAGFVYLPLNTAYRAAGTGLGLQFAKLIVQTHVNQGRVGELRLSNDQGAVFQLLLP